MHIRFGRLAFGPILFSTIVLGATQSPAAQPGDSSGGRLETKHVDSDGRVRLQVGPGRGNTLKLVPFPEDQQQSPDATKTNAADRRSSNRRSESSAARIRIGHSSGAPQELSQQHDSRDVGELLTNDEPAQRLPATAIAPKSEFQPRFRKPDVRQAQHLDPAESNSDQAVEPATFVEPARSEQPSNQPADDTAELTNTDSTPGVTTQVETSPSEPNVVPEGNSAAGGKSLIEAAYAKSKQARTDKDYTAIIDLCLRASQMGLKSSHETYSQSLRSWAYNRRGEARVEQGREKEALADFESAVRFNDTSWRAVHNRGVSLAALGRTEQAIADFDRTIELNPKYGNAYFNRGELHYASGNFVEAIRDYTVAIDLGPADPAMHNSRGHAYYRLKRFGDALRDYGAALELDPQNAPALVNRGDTYLDVGRYAEAAADYRAAITADETNGRAYQAAAWLMATCPDEHYRDEQLAVEAARKAVELDGPNHRNLEALAAAQANASMFNDAKDTQERAIALVPRSQLVAAEKRMALYQRDLAYREVSRQDMIIAQQQKREAEAESKPFAVKQASADMPEDDPGAVTYPETQPNPQRRGSVFPPSEETYDEMPQTQPKRSFWPNALNPFSRQSREPGPQPRQRTLPKRPTRPQKHQNIRPW